MNPAAGPPPPPAGPLTVGLTGGIAAGKSTVAARLAARGAVLVDSDVLAREAVAPGTAGLAAVADRFGPAVLTADGSLDRPALGRVVFADAAARAALNGIVHPLVRARTAELVAAAPDSAVVVHDVPLLVELGMGPRYHLVVVVGADAGTRVARLVSERGMSADDARARLAAQAGDDARRAAADVWLDNTGGTGEVLDAVDRLWADRLAPWAANLVAHRRTTRPDTPTLVAHDPAWAGAAARRAARIAWLCRDHPAAGLLSVSHVGSTAVPGIRARPVLDLQLAVPSMAVADELDPALASGGFVRVAGIDRDNPRTDNPGTADPGTADPGTADPGSADPGRWAKRLYGGTDPGEVVHLHVRAAGSPGWRYALLFRDHLRADPAAAAAYEAEKLRLAAAKATTDAYAAAKEPWFDAALARAQAWADATGWSPTG